MGIITSKLQKAPSFINKQIHAQLLPRSIISIAIANKKSGGMRGQRLSS